MYITNFNMKQREHIFGPYLKLSAGIWDNGVLPAEGMTPKELASTMFDPSADLYLPKIVISGFASNKNAKDTTNAMHRNGTFSRLQQPKSLKTQESKHNRKEKLYLARLATLATLVHLRQPCGQQGTHFLHPGIQYVQGIQFIYDGYLQNYFTDL